MARVFGESDFDVILSGVIQNLPGLSACGAHY